MNITVEGDSWLVVGVVVETPWCNVTEVIGFISFLAIEGEKVDIKNICRCEAAVKMEGSIAETQYVHMH